MLQSRRMQPLFAKSASVFHSFLSLDHLQDLYRTASSTDGFHRNLLSQLDVSALVVEGDVERIPRSGPLLAVANHPFGMLEGSLLGTILPSIRQDYKIMTNQLLSCMPELGTNCIFVDPFQDKNCSSLNRRALRECVRWLRGGHMLVMFPAGEVSHWSLRNNAVADSQWSGMAARLIRMTGSAALPIYFKGTNSLPFHVLGMMHPSLRTARLPHELLNKRGKSVEIRVGSVIPFTRIASIPDETEATAYLRWRTYLLGSRSQRNGRTPDRSGDAGLHLEPLANGTSKELMAADLLGLGAEQLLEDSGEFSVYLADARQIPNLILEVGRLREVTFRAVGEGTGKSRDLDVFDNYYQHLILWNKIKLEVVGAYRIGNAHKIISQYGVKGLYTNTLFHFDPAFFRGIGPALELGRSFVRQEYQKRFSPLLLLWKGLARHVSRHPETPVLFGAVSISNDYSPTSRQLLARYLKEQQSNDKLSKLVRARRPFLRNSNGQGVRTLCRDLEGLSEAIADIELDRKGVPVLLSLYLKLGGKMLGFNLDSHFANALDGLVLLDLRATSRDMLGRYMGKETATDFLARAGSGELRISA